MLSRAWLFATLWTVASQAALSREILQARILEWVAIPFSRESFQPRDRIWVSWIAGGFFTVWATSYTCVSQVVTVVKNLPVKAVDTRDEGLIPRTGRSPGEGNGVPLQYSHWKNPMGRGAWRATVHGVSKTQTQLEQLSTHIHTQLCRESYSELLKVVIAPCFCTVPTELKILMRVNHSYDSSSVFILCSNNLSVCFLKEKVA